MHAGMKKVIMFYATTYCTL